MRSRGRLCLRDLTGNWFCLCEYISDFYFKKPISMVLYVSLLFLITLWCLIHFKIVLILVFIQRDFISYYMYNIYIFFYLGCMVIFQGIYETFNNYLLTIFTPLAFVLTHFISFYGLPKISFYFNSIKMQTYILII